MEHSYKLIVSSNRKYPLLHTPETVYVEAGRAVRLKNAERISAEEREFLDSLPFGDDTEENISARNPEWNEMTVIYWAFRNYDRIGNPEYIGFEQYRRHFIFDRWRKVPGRGIAFQFEGINPGYEKALRQDSDNVGKYLSEYDLLYPVYPMRCSVYEQYRREAANGHHIEDLDLTVRIISELFPAYKSYAEKYLNGRMNYFCNMFVMRKDLFFEYCSFIFPVLFEFEKRRDNSDRSFAERRFFVSERLTGIFICRMISEHQRCCPLPMALVSERTESIPVFEKSPGADSAVVMAAEKNGAAAAAACIASIGENLERAAQESTPDLLLLTETLSIAEKRLLSETAESFGLKLIFPDFTRINHDAGTRGLPEADRETLRLLESPGFLSLYLLPYLREYRKTAFIDIGSLVLGDLSELLKSAADSAFAAVPASLRGYIESKAEALASGKKHRALPESSDFFSAPLVILNTGNKESSEASEWLRKEFDSCGKNASHDAGTAAQQELRRIREEFRERFSPDIELIPCSWDIEPELVSESSGNKLLSEDAARLIEEVRRVPGLISFSRSDTKPWIRVVYAEDLIWWKYLKKCSCYEALLLNVNGNQSGSQNGRASLKASDGDAQSKKRSVLESVAKLIKKAVRRILGQKA